MLRLLLLLAAPVWAGPPVLADSSPDWYYPRWLVDAQHAPVFEVRDTVNKYGRYASEIKIITLGKR